MTLAASGASITLHGKTWSHVIPIPGLRSAFAYSVACSSTENCAAIGLSGQATIWKHGHWSKPVVVFPGGFMAGVQVACAKPVECMAVNDRGSSASY